MCILYLFFIIFYTTKKADGDNVLYTYLSGDFKIVDIKN